MKTSNKGFTLIELLIVITVIGILAVAFLPSLLGAPGKARDTQRKADLQRLAGVLTTKMVSGSLPGSGCIDGTSGSIYTNGTTASTGGTDFFKAPDFGGKIPVDPDSNIKDGNKLPTDGAITCIGRYYYKKAPTNYSFGLYAHPENKENANSDCDESYGGDLSAGAGETEANWCYAILVQ